MKELMRSRQAVGVAGVALALIGIGLDNQWVIWAAIGVLAVSVLHRVVIFLRNRRG